MYSIDRRETRLDTHERMQALFLEKENTIKSHVYIYEKAVQEYIAMHTSPNLILTTAQVSHNVADPVCESCV